VKALICSLLFLIVFGSTNAIAQDEFPAFCYEGGVLIPDNPDPNCQPDPSMPIDSGVGFIIAAVVFYAIFKMRGKKVIEVKLQEKATSYNVNNSYLHV
jgi:hypothetical protein